MRLSEVRACRPEALHTAAREFAEAEGYLDQIVDRINTEIRNRLATGWRGTASAAALAYLDRLQRDVAQVRDRAGDAARAVTRFAEALSDAQPLVAAVERIARAERLELGEDGRVDIPATPWPVTEEEQRQRLSAAQEAHGLLNRALTMATTADIACARELASGLPGAAGASTGAATGAAFGTALEIMNQWPFNVFGRDDPSLLLQIWGGLISIDNVEDRATFLDLLGIPGAGYVSELANPFPAVVGQVVDVVDIYGNVTGLVRQGDPANAFEEQGSDYVADVMETGFGVTTTAYALQPYNPVLAAAVVATGLGWATAAHWDKIEDANSWAWDRVGDGVELVEWGWEAGGDVLDDAQGAWDSGTELVGDVAGGLGDAIGL